MTNDVFSGLHSFINICVCGIFMGGGINLESLLCSVEKCVLMIFL